MADKTSRRVCVCDQCRKPLCRCVTLCVRIWDCTVSLDLTLYLTASQRWTNSNVFNDSSSLRSPILFKQSAFYVSLYCCAHRDRDREGWPSLCLLWSFPLTSLTLTLYLTALQLWANCSVLNDSSAYCEAGVIVAMTAIRELPPRDCLSAKVSLDSL